MKTTTLHAIVLTVIVLLGLPAVNMGQALLDENFDYTAGDNITAHGWAAHSGGGTQPITIASPGLSFPGYVNSGIGNAALVDNNGEDDSKGFTTQTSGTIYAAFMVKVTAATTGYFFHFSINPINTTFRGKVFMDGTNHFGVSVGSNTGTYAAGSFTPGATYLLVVKYQIVTGSSNDIVSLFIFNSSFPATEPLPSIGPLTDATQTDINPGTVALRQYAATQNVTVDGIRVAKSWSDLAPPPPIPTLGEWGLIFMGLVLLIFGTLFILRWKGTSA